MQYCHRGSGGSGLGALPYCSGHNNRVFCSFGEIVQCQRSTRLTQGFCTLFPNIAQLTVIAICSNGQWCASIITYGFAGHSIKCHFRIVHHYCHRLVVRLSTGYSVFTYRSRHRYCIIWISGRLHRYARSISTISTITPYIVECTGRCTI